MRDHELMTARELCVYLRIHYSTMFRMRGRGELPYFRVANRIRFSRADIDRWRFNREQFNSFPPAPETPLSSVSASPPPQHSERSPSGAVGRGRSARQYKLPL